METSFTFELPPERLVRMIRAHGVERVMFGTDSPWAGQAEEAAHVRSLGLTEEELDKVLFTNAARLLRI
jgi:predicted TIM-barrel fold metal-dependent hydrolase